MAPALPESTKPVISIHPAAAIFPLMSDEEIASLAASIETHGLREKIHAIPTVSDARTDWQIVDGRNRLEALRRHLKMSDVDIIAAHMIPVNLDRMHATVEEYVLMANIERRNLTQAQRRDLAGKLAIMLEEQQATKPKDEQVDTLDEAARQAGVSRRTAATAKKEVKALKPAQAGTAKAKKAEPAKFVPTRPNSVRVWLELIAKTVTYSEPSKDDPKVEVLELDKWTVEEAREAMSAAKLIADTIALYIPTKLKREEEALKKRLSELQDPAVTDEDLESEV